MSKKLSPEQLEKYHAVRDHMKVWGKSITATLGERTSFAIHRLNHKQGLYTYTEKQGTKEMGRVTMKMNGKGFPEIHASYPLQSFVDEALKDFRIKNPEKLTVKEKLMMIVRKNRRRRGKK